MGGYFSIVNRTTSVKLVVRETLWESATTLNMLTVHSHTQLTENMETDCAFDWWNVQKSVGNFHIQRMKPHQKCDKCNNTCVYCPILLNTFAHRICMVCIVTERVGRDIM